MTIDDNVEKIEANLQELYQELNDIQLKIHDNQQKLSEERMYRKEIQVLRIMEILRSVSWFLDITNEHHIETVVDIPFNLGFNSCDYKEVHFCFQLANKNNLKYIVRVYGMHMWKLQEMFDLKIKLKETCKLSDVKSLVNRIQSDIDYRNQEIMFYKSIV